MSPRVVLVLGLLLVPLLARAAPPDVEGRLSILEPVTVSEQHSSAHGHGFQLAFKPLQPDPALARFSVEDARIFVAAMEAAFPASKPRSGPSSLMGAVTSGMLFAPPTGAQPSDLERRVRAGYEELYGPSSLPLPSSLENSRWFLALKRSPHYMDEGVREAAMQLLSSPAVAYSMALSMMLYMAAWAAPEPALKHLYSLEWR
ncbi:hypothetical protein [Archangium sp.]|uniref:hypothetical protein n=1 Tax=Archangium sp. TaxID=1872627 RepID=UPI00286AE8DB|nr:hypothetical protein [Archangium sp.]